MKSIDFGQIIFCFLISSHFLLNFVSPQWTVKKFSIHGKDGHEVLLMKAKAERFKLKGEDNEIYHVKPLEWPHAERHHQTMQKDAVVKIVKTVKDENEHLRKTFAKLTQEVKMLWLARTNASQRVVQIFEDHILKDRVYMVLEKGEETLEKTIDELHNKWLRMHNGNASTKTIEFGSGFEKLKLGIYGEIHSMLLDMSKALADMHKFAIHLSMKLSNWVNFNVVHSQSEQKIVKLIDLQTALATDVNGNTVNIQKNWIYACAEPDESKDPTKHYWTGDRNHASPEHKRFCSKITEDGQEVDKNGLSTKTDIWSFGVNIVEILLKVPFIQGKSKWRTDWKIHAKKLKLYGIISRVFNADEEEEWPVKEDKAEAKSVTNEFMAVVEEIYPHLHILLLAIFVLAPTKRPTAFQIGKYLDAIGKFIEDKKGLPDSEEAARIMRGNVTEKVAQFHDNKKVKENMKDILATPKDDATIEWEKNAELVVEDIGDAESSKALSNPANPSGSKSKHPSLPAGKSIPLICLTYPKAAFLIYFFPLEWRLFSFFFSLFRHFLHFFTNF